VSTAAFSVGDSVDWVIVVEFLGKKSFHPTPMLVAEIIDAERMLLRHPGGGRTVPVRVDEVRRRK